MSAVYLLDGEPVDLETFVAAFVERGYVADVERALARRDSLAA